MEEDELNSKVTFLTIWLLLTNLALGFCIYKICMGHIVSDEVTAKRINIIGEDRLPRIILSNEVRQHSGRIGDKDLLYESKLILNKVIHYLPPDVV